MSGKSSPLGSTTSGHVACVSAGREPDGFARELPPGGEVTASDCAYINHRCGEFLYRYTDTGHTQLWTHTHTHFEVNSRVSRHGHAAWRAERARTARRATTSARRPSLGWAGLLSAALTVPRCWGASRCRRAPHAAGCSRSDASQSCARYGAC